MPDHRAVSADSVWLRPVRAGRDEVAMLSRGQIAAGAIALLDSGGLAGLSMRSLGAHLGAGTASMFWYVRTQDDLHELVVDEALGEVPLPPADGVQWRELAAELAHEIRALIVRHPWLPSLLGSNDRGSGPRATALSDASLGLFFAAGFSGGAAAYASMSINSFAVGTGISDTAWQAMLGSTGLSPDEVLATVDEQLDDAVDTLPNYHRWRAETGTPNMTTLREDAFEFGLQRLLDGLADYRGDTRPD